MKKKLAAISSRIELNAVPLYFAVSDGSLEDRRKFFDVNLSTIDGRLDRDVPCRERVWVDALGVVHSESKLKMCYGLTPVVRYNGDVVVCCRCRWYGKVVGNAFIYPLKEIMDSEQYRLAEARALKREYGEYCKFCS